MTTESVWDYPRPPRCEANRRLLRVESGGRVIAETTAGWRVLETSHPPAFYFPPEDVARELLSPAPGRTVCEFKGVASYWDILVEGSVARSAAWSYADPRPGYETLRDHLAFYPSRVDRCTVDGEEVSPQAGDFYGGWITSEVVGPFKGGPGTSGW